MLREERDANLIKIKEITERNKSVENELFPLQEKIRELTVKTEELTSDNAKLRAEALQWRQRANALVERSNKNPEDFKRLQTERENLAKMLTSEKEKNEKAETELTSVKQEKNSVETELAGLVKNIQSLNEEKRKLAEEIAAIKQQNVRMNHEIIEMKNTLLQRDDEVKKLVDELASKEDLLSDSRNKEIQIRKIAKKYKDSYFELKKVVEERDAESAARPMEQQAADLADRDTTSAQATQELNDRITDLDNSVKIKLEENEVLKSQIEALNKRLKEKEDAHTTLLKDLQTSIQTLTEEKSKFSRELAVTKTQLLNCEQTRGENETLKFQNDSKITRMEKELSDLENNNKEVVSRLSRENETLSARISQLNRQLGMQQGTKPTTSSSSMEKSPSDPARTANVKPMAGPSTQQSAAVTPRRGGDTPLASIRPMSVQNSRTAAVLPTSQTQSLSSVHGSSSSNSASCTASVTALVPPQQVHTTGMTAEAMSTTSSHTDYMPATSSAALVVAAVPPMGSGSAENVQEAESIEDSSSSSTQIIVQQQAVALVSPRQHEAAPQNIVQPQSQQQMLDQLHSASTSASSSTSTSGLPMSTHNQASSTSNTVTTTQAGHKRPREVETDSTEEFASDASTSKKPQTKRTRVQIGSSTSQGISESSCLEVEYQVPTSSQRDQDDDNIIVVDSEDEDDMPDDEPVEPDDAPFEDDADNVEAFDLDEGYGQAQEMSYEGGSADIYGENLQSDTNEVEIDDCSEVPNQSENPSNAAAASDVGTSQVVGQSTSSNANEPPNPESSPKNQQSQTISSGSESGPSTSAAAQNTTWRQQATTTPSRQQQQQQQNLMLQQSYEETSDDSIVPSTPTLYIPRRADGFSEAVSSPHPQVQQAARFTFAESGSRANLAAEGMDDTRVDLSQLDANAAQPAILSPRRDAAAISSESANTTQAGPSTAGLSEPEVATATETGRKSQI